MIQDIMPKKLFNEYHVGETPRNGSVVLFFHGKEHRKLLALKREKEIHFPLWEETPAKIQEEGHFQYLFSIDSRRFFLLTGADEEKMAAESVIPEGWSGAYAYYTLFDLRAGHAGTKPQMFAFMTALQLAGWYRDNRFCGTCGSPTVHSDRERALCCPKCGRVIYPRVVPAVIVAVTNGDMIVLTRYAGRLGSQYALIAGFTEIGETLEETVAREVMEEVGLKVKNIRYYKSQPWGVADDILAGFYCEVDGSKEITLDRNELKEARWFRREDIQLLSDDFSLTNEMMMEFKEGRQ